MRDFIPLLIILFSNLLHKTLDKELIRDVFLTTLTILHFYYYYLLLNNCTSTIIRIQIRPSIFPCPMTGVAEPRWG